MNGLVERWFYTKKIFLIISGRTCRHVFIAVLISLVVAAVAVSLYIVIATRRKSSDNSINSVLYSADDVVIASSMFFESF